MSTALRTTTYFGHLRLILVALLAAVWWPSWAASPQFTADCRALTQFPNRLTGSPEYTVAARYVEQRLRDIGVDQVIVQQFPAAQLVTKRCDVTLKSGKVLRLYPARPNGIIPPVTPPSGLTGGLLYAGKGELADYGTRSPIGKIVVLDFNSQRGWLRAFRLGAAAVIFVANGEAESWSAHYTEAATNLPRFYYAGPRADLVEGATATIRSEVTWKQGVGRNVIGFLRGTQPQFNEGMDAEALVLAANLDTYGEVPDLTPGARGAANCAGLLHMAEYLVQHRPQRHVAFTFFDDQAHGHLGVSAFYRALETGFGTVNLDNRSKSLDGEGNFLRTMVGTLRNLDGLSKRSSGYDEISRRLKFKSAEHVYDLNDRLQETRIQDMKMAAADKNWQTPQETKDRIARLEAEKQGWNDLRRALGGDDFNTARKPNLRDKLADVVGEVLAGVAKRQAELVTCRQALDSDRKLAALFGKTNITLHISLLLGDTSPRWGVLFGGDSVFHYGNDQPGFYGQIQTALGALRTDLAKAGTPLAHFEAGTTDGARPSKLFWAAPLIHSGEIAGRLGYYNLSIGTVQERLAREGTPDDTLAKLRSLDWFETNAGECAMLLAAAGNADTLSLRGIIGSDKNYLWPRWDNGGQLVGPTVMGTSSGSTMPNKPMPDTVVQFFMRPQTGFAYQPRKAPGFDNFQVLMTDANANYALGPVAQDPAYASLRGFAAEFDDRGEVLSASDTESSRTVQTRLNVFVCAKLAGDGSIAYRRSGAAVLTPQVDSAETKVLQAISDSPLETGKSNAATVDGVVYWYCDRTVDGIKLFGLQSLVTLVTSLDPSNLKAPLPRVAHGIERKDGLGHPLSEPWPGEMRALTSSYDLWRLNNLRLDLLRSKGIINSSLEELHARAEDLWTAAQAEKRTDAREGLAAASFLSSRPVYDTVRMSLDDLVRAVLILLALAIPFAFALERLLIGSTNIYRQITWFCVFFTATFLILASVHPAFAVSSEPIIIFLAFALMVMSSLVIAVIMQKFEHELKVLQGLTSTVHSADVSRVSTMMAAMGMGISTMRRRPLRTALTALTITLLTFTILNFASFDTRTGVVTLFSGASQSYAGVLFHKANWAPLENDVLGLIAGRWGKASTVTARYWLPAGVEANGAVPPLSLADGSNPTAIRGVLGIDPEEIAQRSDFQEIFHAEGAALQKGVFLSSMLATKLGLQVNSMVMIGGIPLRVAGLLTSSEVARVKDMDSNGILPVDFGAMAQSQPPQQQQLNQPVGSDVLTAAQNKQDWVELPTDEVVVVSSETAKALGASLRVITVYTANTQSASTIAEDAARMLPLPIAATRADGVYTHVLAPTVMAKGMKDLLFPILLGGLVIFGTMLGSVADREKEIYTFSALGLAPAHVATLFFAEALVYSFIGGLGGYLLAQGVLKLLTFLAQFGVVAVPEMNYSSFNAIVTILIVMVTVLVSAIYPAIKASRSANPGILRTWRLPVPEGDQLHIAFPFTVSQYDITGVISFLKEHFNNFTDTSLGVFMSRDTRIKRHGKSLGLSAVLALAPFDLGVTQSFELESVPSEIPGIDEVKITIVRQSGQPKDWERLNKVLLDDLRRQFLIWRSLPQETMDIYRQQTLVTLGDAVESMPEPTVPTAPQTV